MVDIDSEPYVRGILSGHRRMIAKTMTLIESSLKDHQQAAFKVMEKILPHTGNSIRLGVTGVPGVGKSTFIENLGDRKSVVLGKSVAFFLDIGGRRII